MHFDSPLPSSIRPPGLWLGSIMCVQPQRYDAVPSCCASDCIAVSRTVKHTTSIFWAGGDTHLSDTAWMHAQRCLHTLHQAWTGVSVLRICLSSIRILKELEVAELMYRTWELPRFHNERGHSRACRRCRIRSQLAATLEIPRMPADKPPRCSSSYCLRPPATI